MQRFIYCGLLAGVIFMLGAALVAADRPNVILFIADDVSWDDYGCYGNAAARTPHIDRLARGGLRFDAAFLTASSCSPSRSSIITGRYPHNTGQAAELHLPIDARLPWFPTLLRRAGYYTALVGKNHMKSAGSKPGPVLASQAEGDAAQPQPFDFIDAGNGPGNRGGHATWVKTLQDRPRDKPFFFWFASYDAHREWDGSREWDEARYGPKHDPAKVSVPPFLSDDRDTRQDLAAFCNEVTRFDYFVGEVVQELERQEILNNTLLLLMADNGRPFPRAKTRLHDSGMKTGLIAHWPAGITSGGATSPSLVSAIDLAPTILELAGVTPADPMQGVSLAPLFSDPHATVREFAFSEHNWHDYEACGRCVRSAGFLYVRNLRPQLAWQGPADSVRSVAHQQLRHLRDKGGLNEAQSDVFLAPRPNEELYRTSDDPLQIRNLAGDPEFAAVQQRLSAALDQWIRETGDSVPNDLSRDAFDRETGDSLKLKPDEYRGSTPGQDRDAAGINAPGPR